MQEQHTITHIEIPAPDIKKAIAFYSALFNWQIELQPQNDYAFFRIIGTGSGGGLDASLQPAPEKSGVQITIIVYFNGNREKQSVKLENNRWKSAILNNQITANKGLSEALTLNPYSCTVLYIE